jgi:protein subunit release factor A
MQKTIEIRPAEGGMDSTLLAADLCAAYIKLCASYG